MSDYDDNPSPAERAARERVEARLKEGGKLIKQSIETCIGEPIEIIVLVARKTPLLFSDNQYWHVFYNVASLDGLECGAEALTDVTENKLKEAKAAAQTRQSFYN
jgi:hypothetical protein